MTNLHARLAKLEERTVRPEPVDILIYRHGAPRPAPADEAAAIAAHRRAHPADLCAIVRLDRGGTAA